MASRSCREAAMDFLARREHSRLELEQKLSKLTFAADEISQTLTQLAAENLQSNERFAESFAAQRAENGHGDVKIRYELQQRGVDDAFIHQALLPYQGCWFEFAKTQRQKHFGSWPEDYQARVKQSRYLQRRGYDFDVISRIFSADYEEE